MIGYDTLPPGQTVHHFVIDFVAIGSIVGSFAGFLPAVATFLAVIWYGIQIYSWAKGRIRGSSKATARKARRKA